jgi:RNA polymerase sigma-70 factor (ECF subfamily)
MRDPPETILESLHRRLLMGDRLASPELVGHILACLQQEMERLFPQFDPHLVSDGVIDAVLDYCARPTQFDASRGVPLDRFLSRAARGNVRNLMRSERRRKNREKKVGEKKCEIDVALDPAVGNIQQEELKELEGKRAEMLSALKDERDRQMLTLRLEGVRETPPYAQILGITHLPLEEQREQVNRHKERITRFLRRKGLL